MVVRGNDDRNRCNCYFPGVLPFTRADLEQTVYVRFEQVVRRFPNHIALVGNGERWTYLDLNRRVNRIGHAIKESTKPGVGCVAFLLDHWPEMVIATLAVLKAGKVYLAIHPRTPATAQREIGSGCEARTDADNRCFGIASP